MNLELDIVQIYWTLVCPAIVFAVLLTWVSTARMRQETVVDHRENLMPFIYAVISTPGVYSPGDYLDLCVRRLVEASPDGAIWAVVESRKVGADEQVTLLEGRLEDPDAFVSAARQALRGETNNAAWIERLEYGHLLVRWTTTKNKSWILVALNMSDESRFLLLGIPLKLTGVHASWPEMINISLDLAARLRRVPARMDFLERRIAHLQSLLDDYLHWLTALEHNYQARNAIVLFGIEGAYADLQSGNVESGIATLGRFVVPHVGPLRSLNKMFSTGFKHLMDGNIAQSEFKQVSLRAAFNEFFEDYLQSCGRDYQVDIAEDHSIVVPPVVFNQVVFNVLGNAVKYTSRTPNAKIWVWSSYDTERRLVVLHIKDNGPGISELQGANLGRYRYRGDGDKVSSLPGEGLGLWSAFRYMKMVGGGHYVISGPDWGAEVQLSFIPNWVRWGAWHSGLSV